MPGHLKNGIPIRLISVMYIVYTPRYLYAGTNTGYMAKGKKIVMDVFGWGIILWLIGYAFSMLLFMFVPTTMLGWIITPVCTVIALWVLIKKIRSAALSYYLLIGIVWTVIAVLFDYFFIVKAFKPEDGYYKPDVYLYYGLTFILPLIVGLRKKRMALLRK